MNQGISILGVPMWLGQSHYGSHLGPDALRAAGVRERLLRVAHDVVDAGNIAVDRMVCKKGPVNAKNIKPIAEACQRLADQVDQLIAQDRFPLVIGGDHSIAIGTLAGVGRHYNNLGVIWYDAHADMNTLATTPSGNIHGMPLAVAMGKGHRDLVAICGDAYVKPENIVLIGVRDVDPGEKALIESKNICIYSAVDVQRLGITSVMEKTIQYLSDRCDGIHLSFDLDGIDPTEIPGVGTPVKSGISYADSLQALHLLRMSGVITSAELVELNPLLDKEQRSVQAALHLLETLLGTSMVKPAGVEVFTKSYEEFGAATQSQYAPRWNRR